MLTQLPVVSILLGLLAIVMLAAIYRIVQKRRAGAPPAPADDAIAETPVADLQEPVPARPATVSLYSPVEKAASTELPPIDPEEIPSSDTSDYVFGSLTPVLAALLPESAERKREMKRELQNAGYYEPHAWQNLSAIRYLGIALPILFFGILLILVPPQLEAACIVGLVAAPILGWSLPGLAVRSRGQERLRQIERAMPDMLDVLNMCVSQGMTIQSSLARVSREFAAVYPALAQELKIVVEQTRVGSLEQALVNFSRRCDVPDVHSFTALIIQTERMGTSVSEALAEYSDNMRETLRQQADEKANTAAFKLLFPTVLCLMPAVYLFLLGPAVIELSDFFTAGGLEALDNSAAQLEEL